MVQVDWVLTNLSVQTLARHFKTHYRMKMLLDYSNRLYNSTVPVLSSGITRVDCSTGTAAK